MSIRQGKKLIASSTTNGFNLFDCKWADHILNNISWLRADTFSWQSGDVYTAAYQHLANELLAQTNAPIYAWEHEVTGAVYYTTTLTPRAGDKTLEGVEITSIGEGYIVVKGAGCFRDPSQDTTISLSKTDTIGDITITYALAEDGHKICLPDQESNLVALYNKTGVAWYYILDTTNRQFKLPRTKWGFTGIRNGVGGYVAPGLPDHNHKIIIDTKWGSKNDNNGPNWCGDDATRATNIAATSTNASQSNSIYGASDTVQPPATQMYLYFYVGNFEQSAIEQTAGITSEQLNNKADISLFNAIYPVGSIYIGTQSTCPMEIAIPGSSWELLEAGRALWTGNGSNGNTTIAAGLPNIDGNINVISHNILANGAFSHTSSFKSHGWDGTANGGRTYNFNASRSSSIYGNSTTVQPPAYVVNVWRRTA